MTASAVISLAQETRACTEDFETVVETYRPRIFRFALASLRDRDAAETVTQDCFVRAWNSREHFRYECSLNTWLMQIAVNLIRDQARNRRWRFWRNRQAALSPTEALGNRVDKSQRSPESIASCNQQVEAIWKTAEKLPERQRTVFLLRFVEDMDILQIVEVTGMKEGTVKTHLFRAIHSVRERLGAA